MTAVKLLPDANNDPDEMLATERFGIALVLGLMLITAMMLSALLYLY